MQSNTIHSNAHTAVSVNPPLSEKQNSQQPWNDNTPEIQEYIRKIQEEEDIFNKALFAEFLRNKGIKTKVIAERLQLSPSYISNLLRLLKLPPLIRDGYYSGTINPTHLFIISRLKTEKDMVDAYEQTLAGNLSTADVEALVRKALYGISTTGNHVGDDVKNAIEQKYSEIDDAIKTRVIQTRVKAKVIIEARGNLSSTSAILKKLAE